MIDYIPSKESEFVLWSDNFCEHIAENAAAWGITEKEVKDLQTAVNSFTKLLMIVASPARNSVIVAEKDAARKTLIAKIRALVNFQLKNPVITNAQRIAMGLRPRKTGRTRISVSNIRPEIRIHVVDFRILKIFFHDAISGRKAKPYGIIGAVLAFAVLDTPPANCDDLTNKALATRSPYVLEFSKKDRGKTVYMAICWQNKRGEMGPWSEIISAVIP
jgi:hypothetical protein